MYQPSTPWGAPVSLMLGFSCTITLVLGGGGKWCYVVFECPVELGLCGETGVFARASHEVT
jgi:hypothetical protein